LVQLPEPTERKDYATIADITKECLRRAGAMISEQLAMNKKKESEGSLFTDHCSLPIDLGFRVFKLASSNIRAWEPDRENLAQTLEEAVEHLKTDRTEQDILYEVLLKRGIDLCTPIEQRVISGKAVHSIGAGTLLVCLAPSITQAEAEPVALGLAAWHKEQAPAGESTVVFRDSAFADDVAKTNLAAILQQHGLTKVMSL
jgi:adenine-specific DNA-methyltransferase